MFNFFSKPSVSSELKTKIKGYKVSRNSERSKKFGIAAGSLEMLKTKVGTKLKMKKFNLFLSDGLEIDDEDYFQSLPAQSVIIVAEDGEEVKTGRRKIIFLKFNFNLSNFRFGINYRIVSSDQPRNSERARSRPRLCDQQSELRCLQSHQPGSDGD